LRLKDTIQEINRACEYAKGAQEFEEAHLAVPPAQLALKIVSAQSLHWAGQGRHARHVTAILNGISSDLEAALRMPPPSLWFYQHLDSAVEGLENALETLR
jgi:hypothetical protein